MALPIDITDPGMVNVEDQAYPPVPPDFQALPPNLGDLLSASLFAGPIAGQPPQALPTPVDVSVAGQAALPPSFSQGFATPALVDIDPQDVPSPFAPDEFLVTEVGSFLTNPTPESLITVTIVDIVDSATGAAPTDATVNFRITLDTNLAQFGVPIPGRELIVLTSGAALWVGQILITTLASFNVVYADNPRLGSAAPYPAAGDTMSLDVSRESFEVVNDLTGIVANAFPSTETQPGPDAVVSAAIGLTQGLSQANSGVLNPFIGGGVPAPPFIGTFEVEDQTPLGQGLPANVFI